MEKAAPDEKIFYVDVTSLYPWVNNNCTYPIGHPKIITNPSELSMTRYFGIALIDILPPEGLYFPVLPARGATGRLTFPLCRTCSESEVKIPLLERSPICPHTDQERTLRGTWCTPEILKVVSKGYRIIKIYEVWHFPPEQQETGLFKDYVNEWLKLKTEASGWPDDVRDDLVKQSAFIQQYEERERIVLDAAEIRKNPGRKSTAKLMLNSFWGKFGEKDNKSVTQQLIHSHPSVRHPR